MFLLLCFEPTGAIFLLDSCLSVLLFILLVLSGLFNPSMSVLLSLSVILRFGVLNSCLLLRQIVCETSDVFASGCAVARAYPLYSRKTDDKNAPR